MNRPDADPHTPPENHLATLRSNLPRYERLRDEVLFTIGRDLDAAGIKTHTLLGRVKDQDSFLEKIQRKNYTSPFEQMPDIVGVRVVVLFLSDLPRVREIIASRFSVLSEEDTTKGEDDATFGYMSVHFTVTLPPPLAGPRYDDLKGLRCEIQVRTILMDAWANVSHYLAYKESSIPSHLRRDFYALSGLFYVADQHFQMFFGESLRSQEAARSRLGAGAAEDTSPIELNLDTLLAFLAERYPERRQLPRSDESLSEFIEEAEEAGYYTVQALDRQLRRADDAFRRYEEWYRVEYEKMLAEEGLLEDDDEPLPVLEGFYYAALAAARISLAIADKTYSAVCYEASHDAESLEPFREFLK